MLLVDSTFSDNAGVLVSPVRGAAIGAVSALPGTILVVVLFAGAFPGFAASIATAAVTSGIVSGATFGRRIARRPRTATVVWGAVFAVLLGAPVGGTVAWLLIPNVTDPVAAIFAGLFWYGLPALLFLALPAFAFGVGIARHRVSETTHATR
jgi:hypothetical protein